MALFLLQSHQSKEEGADLRGFEWRYLYRLCRGTYAAALPKHEQVLGAMEYSPDGRMLATYCWDRKLRLWNFETKSSKPLLEVPNSTGLGGLSEDGEYLFFGGAEGSIQRYEIKNRQQSSV